MAICKEIDDLDLRITRELEIDGRQSYQGLAAKLGISSSTVRRRMENLLESRAISIITITGPAVEGFETLALFGINVRPGESDAVMERLVSSPVVLYCAVYVGRYDLLVTAAFLDEKEIIRFIDTEIGCIPEIVGFELMIILEIAKRSFSYLGGSRDIPVEPLRRELDERELMLIELVKSNPRESIKSLSKKLDVNRMAVSKALQRLLRENAIRVVSLINPRVFGLHSQALILVDVLPGKVSSVVDRLASFNTVHQIVVVTGKFSIWMWALFEDSDELYRFLRDDLGHIPGVVRYETMLRVAHPRFLPEQILEDRTG